MLTDRDIIYEATVSPELVALLAGNPVEDTPAPAPEPVAADSPPPDAPPPEPEVASSGPWGDLPEGDPAPAKAQATAPWQTLALRCDGQRPVRIRGLSVWCDEAEASFADASGQSGRGRRRFELFLTEAGDIVAQLVVTPPDALPARPIHRVATLSVPGDLGRFLEANDPSDCMAAAPWAVAADGLDALWAGLRLVPPLSPGETLPACKTLN